MIPRGLLPGTPIHINDVQVGDVIDTYDPVKEERSRYHKQMNQTVTIGKGHHYSCDLETDYGLICQNFNLLIQLRHRVNHRLTHIQQRAISTHIQDHIGWSVFQASLGDNQWFSIIHFVEQLEDALDNHALALGTWSTDIQRHADPNSPHSTAYIITALLLQHTDRHGDHPLLDLRHPSEHTRHRQVIEHFSHPTLAHDVIATHGNTLAVVARDIRAALYSAISSTA